MVETTWAKVPDRAYPSPWAQIILAFISGYPVLILLFRCLLNISMVPFQKRPGDAKMNESPRHSQSARGDSIYHSLIVMVIWSVINAHGLGTQKPVLHYPDTSSSLITSASFFPLCWSLQNPNSPSSLTLQLRVSFSFHSRLCPSRPNSIRLPYSYYLEHLCLTTPKQFSDLRTSPPWFSTDKTYLHSFPLDLIFTQKHLFFACYFLPPRGFLLHCLANSHSCCSALPSTLQLASGQSISFPADSWCDRCTGPLAVPQHSTQHRPPNIVLHCLFREGCPLLPAGIKLTA